MPTQNVEVFSQHDLLTPEELCLWLKVGRTWPYERLRSRKGLPLPHIKMGRYLRFSRAAVAVWLEAQHKHAPKPRKAA